MSMSEPRQLARPPIAEAIVDLRIVADERIDVNRLKPLQSELAEEYPKVDERKHFEAEFRIDAGKLIPPTAKDLGFQGLWLTSADDHRIVQFRPDGFTFNNVGLGAYIGGDALLDEALRLWTRFAAFVQPAAVVRLHYVI